MKNTNESGRTITEILAVLAIISILSVGALVGFQTATSKNKINGIVQTMNLGSIQVLTALDTRTFATVDEMDAFLEPFATSSGGYNIAFKAPRDKEFNGREFVAQITDESGERIKGTMCRELLTTMVKVNGVSDIDFTVLDEEMADGTTQDITMRLSGKAVDLNALCGSGVF